MSPRQERLRRSKRGLKPVSSWVSTEESKKLAQEVTAHDIFEEVAGDTEHSPGGRKGRRKRRGSSGGGISAYLEDMEEDGGAAALVAHGASALGVRCASHCRRTPSTARSIAYATAHAALFAPA